MPHKVLVRISDYSASLPITLFLTDFPCSLSSLHTSIQFSWSHSYPSFLFFKSSLHQSYLLQISMMACSIPFLSCLFKCHLALRTLPAANALQDDTYSSVISPLSLTTSRAVSRVGSQHSTYKKVQSNIQIEMIPNRKRSTQKNKTKHAYRTHILRY